MAKQKEYNELMEKIANKEKEKVFNDLLNSLIEQKDYIENNICEDAKDEFEIEIVTLVKNIVNAYEQEIEERALDKFIKKVKKDGHADE